MMYCKEHGETTTAAYYTELTANWITQENKYIVYCKVMQEISEIIFLMVDYPSYYRIRLLLVHKTKP